MKFTFGGDAETTYSEFIDLAKGGTLVASPGETYDIDRAEGASENLPMPPDDNWKAAKATRADTSKES